MGVGEEKWGKKAWHVAAVGRERRMDVMSMGHEEENVRKSLKIRTTDISNVHLSTSSGLALGDENQYLAFDILSGCSSVPNFPQVLHTHVPIELGIFSEPTILLDT